MNQQTPGQEIPQYTVKKEVYNRVEGRVRKTDFGQALEAEIADPLWMLTRQWQWGEFQGEDTGSAILARVQTQSQPFTHLAATPAAPHPVSANHPVEALVEALPVPVDDKLRLQLAQYWRKMLAGAGFSTSVYEQFVAALPLVQPNTPEEMRARAGSPERTTLRRAFAGTPLLDGGLLMDALRGGAAAAGFTSGLSPAQTSTLNALGAQFVQWADALYVPAPSSSGETFWDPERLEYRIEGVSAASTPNGPSVAVLKADEYHSGRLDWFSFDLVEPPAGPPVGLHATPPTRPQTVESNSIIPSFVRFPGMPASRWWELEDGNVNFGKVDLQTTDVAQMLLMEFGLVYSNDWQVLPLNVPAGSLCGIQDVVVTDTFGQRTRIPHPAQNTQDNDWQKWAVFGLSTHDAVPNAQQPTDKRLFVPATIKGLLESRPLEEVVFVRDEMANLVWGIERIVSSGLGEGMDGAEAAKNRRAHILREAARRLQMFSRDLQEQTAGYLYELIHDNGIPDHWIPFQVVQQAERTMLQRGRRRLKAENIVLGDLRAHTALLAPDGLDVPYFLYFSEVPREGVAIETTFQRARNTDGSVSLWLGSRKRPAPGTKANSGLAFDKLTRVNQGNP